MKKIIVLFSFVSGSMIAQSTEDFTKKEVIIVAGPTAGNMTNDNIKSDKYASSRGGNGINFGVNYSYYFIKNVGLNLGVEFDQFSNTTDYKTVYRATDLSLDKDGYLYYKQIESNYTDKRTLNTIDVPIGLRIQSYDENFQVFVDAGVRVNFVLSAKFEEKGTYANKGLYPIKNAPAGVFLSDENDSYYGFANSTYNINHDLGVNKMNISLAVSAGIKAKVKNNLFLIIVPSYVRGINDFMAEASRSDYTNILQEKTAYKPLVVSQFSFKVGLGFKF